MSRTGLDERPLAERDAADERRLLYRRARHAFVRGSARGSLLDEPRRNRPLAAGLGVALLAVVVAGVVGLLTDRPPADWNRDGTLLVVSGSGERYLVVHRTRRAVVNETSLRLVVGASGRQVTVSRGRAHSLAEGPPLGVAAWPFSPPPALERTAPVVACSRADAPLQVLVGATPPAENAAALVTSTDAVFLVSGGRRFRIGDAITGAALGYDTGTAAPVPPAWLALVPEGPALEHIALPPPAPAPPGAPPFSIDNTLVSDASSGRLYVASQGALRPVLHNTALRLVFGVAVPAAVPVPPDVVRTLPQGPPLGVDGQPDTPPALTDTSGRWLCAADPGGVSAVADLPDRGLEAESATRPAARAVLRLPAGRALLAGAGDDRVLLASGSRFPAPTDVLGALGYDTDEARPVPAALLDALAPGPPLRRLPLG